MSFQRAGYGLNSKFGVTNGEWPIWTKLTYVLKLKCQGFPMTPRFFRSVEKCGPRSQVWRTDRQTDKIAAALHSGWTASGRSKKGSNFCNVKYPWMLIQCIDEVDICFACTHYTPSGLVENLRCPFPAWDGSGKAEHQVIDVHCELCLS